MHEPDENETAFPPLPPPPPMTAEQRALAEASIQAALACEAERQAHLMDEVCWNAAPAECISPDSAGGEVLQEEVCEMRRSPPPPMASATCGGALPRAKRETRQFNLLSRRRSAALPTIDLPENKPRKPNLHAANLSFAARVIIWVRDRYANNAPAIYKAAY